MPRLEVQGVAGSGDAGAMRDGHGGQPSTLTSAIGHFAPLKTGSGAGPHRYHPLCGCNDPAMSCKNGRISESLAAVADHFQARHTNVANFCPFHIFIALVFLGLALFLLLRFRLQSARHRHFVT